MMEIHITRVFNENRTISNVYQTERMEQIAAARSKAVPVESP